MTEQDHERLIEASRQSGPKGTAKGNIVAAMVNMVFPLAVGPMLVGITYLPLMPVAPEDPPPLLWLLTLVDTAFFWFGISVWAIGWLGLVFDLGLRCLTRRA